MKRCKSSRRQYFLCFPHLPSILVLSLYSLTFFTYVLLFLSLNDVNSKLNSDWLIPIKVHQRLKKNRMECYSIKVCPIFLWRLTLSSLIKNIVQVFFDKGNIDSVNGRTDVKIVLSVQHYEILIIFLSELFLLSARAISNVCYITWMRQDFTRICR